MVMDAPPRRPQDLSFIKWAVAGPQLAIGTAKGHLLIYNKRTLKKEEIRTSMKRITCGAWNSDHTLALGSEDRQVTLSNAEGETLHQTTLKHEPADVQFYDLGGGDSTMSVVQGGRSLLIFDVRERLHELLKAKIEKPTIELSASGKGLLEAVSALLGDRSEM